ncbi:MAG TPA: hypothetical protein ENJ08_11665 [Gammaproteobacteria bacterium]|nr:hypothetical protein [Gammaproteobacteria bacterium]
MTNKISTQVFTRSNTARKTKRTLEQWKAIISEHEISGLTQRDFCLRQGVAYSSFTHWLKKLKKMAPVAHAEAASMPLFVGIEPEHSASNNWDVELAFANGMVLRLRQN